MFHTGDETVYVLAADPVVLDSIFSEFLFIDTHVVLIISANIYDFVQFFYLTGRYLIVLTNIGPPVFKAF